MTTLLKDKLAALVAEAITGAMQSGALPEVAQPQAGIARPANPEHGDYGTSAALKLARAARMAPLRLAETLVAHLPPSDFVSAVEIAAPGFINFRLSPAWLMQQVPVIIAEGESYGNINLGQGQRVQVEFVSANPTGLIHIGGTRGAVLGDALGNILAAAGYDVAREYYINDAGSRIVPFYNSVYSAYMTALGYDAPPPERYDMAYLAPRLVAVSGDKYAQMPPTEAIPQLGQLALAMVIEDVHTDLDRLGVHFDVWFSEQSLFDSGAVAQTLAWLKEGGHVVQKDGATWFVSTALGQDKDNVLIRSNGTPTYFISDIAYHYNKLKIRGFDKAINIWGADHQGHITRLKTALSTLGLNPDALTILTIQMVSVNGKRSGKSTGNIVNLRELLDDVSADAVRFNLVSRSADTQIDFNLDLARKQSNENPVFYVQYAHARIASILRKAVEDGFSLDAPGDMTLLGNPSELTLIRKVLQLPELIDDAAHTYEVQRLPNYAIELAATFHSFYHNQDENKVVDRNNLALSQARLQLVQATQVALARTLRLLGMSAPEQMARADVVDTSDSDVPPAL